MAAEKPERRPIASYLADPERGRPRPAALLGRARHQRDAALDPGVATTPRSSTLTVNLGQPDEDWDVVDRQGARPRRASTPILVDAREEFARDYVLPGDQGQRPLRRRLSALHRARPAADREARRRAARASTGCDTIAHGCTGKGNDQVRIEATIATLAPELKVIAPVREWRMGREEEIAYAREHGIPVKGGTEAPPYSIDDNLWGRSSEGRAIEDLDRAAARRRLPARHAARGGARRARARPDRLRARACRSRSTASASGSSS